jgi:hypothetical protein
MTVQESDYVERLSRAVSLTVLELDVDRDALVPAYLLANMMSPALWTWRERRRVSTASGRLLSANRRLAQLQRRFHHYTFTHFPDKPGGDPWGLLDFAEEEARLGTSFVRRMRLEYDRTLRALLAQNADSQFGRIVTEDYYHAGYFPRLRNETIEIMDAYGRVSPEGSPSGKCAALAMLWAAALIVWGRFPAEQVTVIGNRAHIFVFLDEGNGHLFNNTRWFNRTRIRNQSELSEYARTVTSSAPTTFLYCPAVGMCHCDERRSEIPPDQLTELLAKVRAFLSVPLQFPDLKEFRFENATHIVPPLTESRSAEQYQSGMWSLAQSHPGSIYDFAQYAFRRLCVPHPEAYARAALRDYHTQRLATGIQSLEDAAAVLGEIRGRQCAFGCRERLALPDETLFFGMGDDREMALLLFALLYHSPVYGPDAAVGFGVNGSYVRRGSLWLSHTGAQIPAPDSDSPIRMFDDRTNWVEEST